MLMPTEAMSVEAMTADEIVPEVAMVAEGGAPEVAPTKVPAYVPKSPRTPRPKPTPTQEGTKPKKDK